MSASPRRVATPFHPFTGRDLPWLVDRQSRELPDKTFLAWEPFAGERLSWTYSEFAAETRAFAAGLATHGIGKGDFVAIHLENCPEFLFAWYACSRLGAVAVTTNTRSAGEELAYFLAHSRAKAAITQPKFASLVARSGPDLRWIACIARDPDEPHGSRPSAALPFEDLRGDPEEAPHRPAEPALANSVQYTSGTTARPKGVVWTHANALWSARINAAHARLTEDDVHLFYFPLFHTNALAYSVLATLWSGGTAVLMPRFSASRFWDVATRNRCTWANMVMFTLRAVEAQPDPGTHSFRFWACAGDFEFVKRRWGIKTTGWFGMTETISHPIASDHDIVGPEASMGFPTPEYEIDIRAEDGSQTPFGAAGRLWVRGVPGLSLFSAYLHDPASTAAAFDADGWFDTGDLVVPLANGHIFFSGRAKDMLKVGGENVAAIEIETAITRTPGVKEAAVVGEPDPLLDEAPAAFVVADDPGPELEVAIRARCVEALADFKRPRRIVFVDELPKGLLDKVLKKELRDRLVQERKIQP